MDLQYLNQSGLKVVHWGLQNEPGCKARNATVAEVCGKTKTPESESEITLALGLGLAKEDSGLDLQSNSNAHPNLASQMGMEIASQEEEDRVGFGVGANSYSMCHYDQCQYYKAFTACAKKVRQYDPDIRIHANSQTGQVCVVF